MKERKSMGYMTGLFIGFLLGCSFGVLVVTNKLKRKKDDYYKEGYNVGYNNGYTKGYNEKYHGGATK